MKHTSPSHISLAKASHMATSNFSSVMIYNFTAGVSISSYMANPMSMRQGFVSLSPMREGSEQSRLLQGHLHARNIPHLSHSKLHFIWTCIVFLLNIKAAAAAKSLQTCLTLCDPIDGSTPGSPVPGILQTRTLEWVAISFSNAWKGKVKVKSLSRV